MSREEFEKWARGYFDLQHISVCYGDDCTQSAFEGWQAALQSGEPVGEVFEVLCDGKIAYINVLDGAVIPHNAKLYTTPQPVVPGDFATGAEALRKTMLEASKAHLWPHIEGVFAVFAKVNSFNPVEGVVDQVLRDKALLSAGKENKNE